jgi:serine phosphatase RsbU (regulator of sigma subunit)
MSRGKYLSLREARKKKQLERFAKEHPSEGDADKLEQIIGAMAKKPESDDQTSPKDESED